MRDCDIKFVNKEITPFGGFSLFFKMLEKCHLAEHLEQSGIPVQGSNRENKPLQLIFGQFAGVWCGASCFRHLDMVRYDTALCNLLAGNAELTIGLTSVISTNSHKPSTSVCSVICSAGSSRNCCLTITHWTLIPQSCVAVANGLEISEAA